MPKPYSTDLRLKVVESIVLNGLKRCEASEQFNISRSTIHDWLKRYEETGDVSPSHHNHRGHSHKITDWSAYEAIAREHAAKTQEEMADLWPAKISDRTISRGLKKIDFTRKKRPTVTKSVMSRRDRSFSNS